MLILIPCKRLDQGKTRLASLLDGPARQALCERFLRQTLELAISMVTPGQIKLVTDDPRAVAIGAGYGVASLPDPGFDLNAALAAARASLLSDPAFESDVLVLPTDLPRATVAAISNVVAQPADAAMVSDHDGQGTNLLFLKFKAFRTFEFAFGPDSCARHGVAARAGGLTMQIVRDDRLSFDIDEPRHYLRWRETMGQVKPSSV
jgi:2-phospho-L-lactate guanylyltransferase